MACRGSAVRVRLAPFEFSLVIPTDFKDDLQSIDDFKLVEKELYRQIKVGDVILLSMRIPYHFGGTYYEFPPSDFIFINKDGSFGSQENYFDNWISSVINLANLAQKKVLKLSFKLPHQNGKEKKINYVRAKIINGSMRFKIGTAKSIVNFLLMKKKVCTKL